MARLVEESEKDTEAEKEIAFSLFRGFFNPAKDIPRRSAVGRSIE